MLIDILMSTTYAFILSALLTFIVFSVHSEAIELLRKNALSRYKKIVGETSWLFEEEGMSPADFGAYIRFFRYVVSYEAKSILGPRLWMFYRVVVPLYALSVLWLFITLFISIFTSDF